MISHTIRGIASAAIVFGFALNTVFISSELLADQITGKVINDSGLPLSGVRVDISTAAPKIGKGIFCPSCYLDCRKFDITNENGEFQIDDLDPTLKFRLVFASPETKTFHSKLINPMDGPVEFTLAPAPLAKDPSHVLTGIVTSEVGIPIEGALVEPLGAKTKAKRWWGQVDAELVVTDAEGRFKIVLPDDYLALDIEVTADGFCGVQKEQLERGKEPVTLAVPTGAKVTGKLIHNDKPLADHSLAVVQTDRAVGRGNIFIKAVNCVTEEDGSFHFENLPSDQQYCIFSVVGDPQHPPKETILHSKLFRVPKSGATRDLGSLTTAPSVTLSGQIVTANKTAIPQPLSLSLGREPAWDLISIPVAADGTFHATGLPPETYEIRLGDRQLEIVTNELNYQSLTPQSFGIHINQSVDNLKITVRQLEKQESK